MDPVTGSMILGGIGSLVSGVGGFMGMNSAANSAAIQRQMQQQQFFDQMDFAREQFYTGGFVDIQNRINAAKAFGVSPLAALGVPSVSLPGIPAGDISGNVADSSNPLAGAGAGLGSMGQDLMRSKIATRTDEEKAMMVAQTKLATKQLDRQDAEINELNARANFYNAHATQTPSFPSPVVNDNGYVVGGQAQSSRHLTAAVEGGPAGGYVNKVPEVTTGAPGSWGSASGRAVPSSEFSWTDNGKLFRQPAQGTPAAQGDIFGSAENWIRNRILPNFDRGGPRDPSIMDAIRQRYPDAVSYEHTGYGYYRPVFPDEQVRSEVRWSKHTGEY